MGVHSVFVKCIHVDTKVEVTKGEKVRTFRGEEMTFLGYSRLRKRIQVENAYGTELEFYPGVCNLALVDDVGEEWA
jgi:hypothetical protein